jgi:Mn2+/Fe2+ NRAMP family transporter
MMTWLLIGVFFVLWVAGLNYVRRQERKNQIELQKALARLEEENAAARRGVLPFGIGTRVWSTASISVFPIAGTVVQVGAAGATVAWDGRGLTTMTRRMAENLPRA